MMAGHGANPIFLIKKIREWTSRKLTSATQNTLNKHAPIKKKCIRAVQSNFMTRELSKTTMKKLKLHNRFLKEKGEVSRKAHTTRIKVF